MVNALNAASTRLFQFAFLALALFIPFSIAGENIAIGFSVLAWLLWLAATRQWPRLAHPLFIASVVLTLSALPSLFMSQERHRAFVDWESYWQLLIVFMVGAHIARVGVRERSCAVLFASAAASCGVAFIQRAGGLHLGPVHIGAEHRVSSTMFTMTLAGILCQLAVFGSAVALSPRAAAEEVVAAARAADRELDNASPELLQQIIAAGPAISLARAHHRNEHLDQIEQALGK